MRAHLLGYIGLSTSLMAGCGGDSSAKSTATTVPAEYTEQYTLNGYTPILNSDNLEGVWVGVINMQSVGDATVGPANTYTINTNTRVIFNVFSSNTDGEDKLYFTRCQGQTGELHPDSNIIDTNIHRILKVENSNTLLLEDIFGNEWSAIKVNDSPKSLGTTTFNWANSQREASIEQVLAMCSTYTHNDPSSGVAVTWDTTQYSSHETLKGSANDSNYTSVNANISSATLNTLDVSYESESIDKDFGLWDDFNGDTLILSNTVNQNRRYMAEYSGAHGESGESVVISVNVNF